MHQGSLRSPKQMNFRKICERPFIRFGEPRLPLGDVEPFDIVGMISHIMFLFSPILFYLLHERNITFYRTEI